MSKLPDELEKLKKQKAQEYATRDSGLKVALYVDYKEGFDSGASAVIEMVKPVLEFYGDKDNWTRMIGDPTLISKDGHGKKARQLIRDLGLDE